MSMEFHCLHVVQQLAVELFVKKSLRSHILEVQFVLPRSGSERAHAQTLACVSVRSFKPILFLFDTEMILGLSGAHSTHTETLA